MFPKDNLLAFWKLDDLTDSRGNRYTLTNNGGVQFVTGKIGACAQFNGSNNLTVPITLNTTTQDFTVSCWFKITQTGQWLISLFQQAGGALNVGINPSGNASFDNGIAPVLTGQSVSLNQWVHLVGVVRSGTAELWINGVLDVSGAWVPSFNLTNAIIGTGGNSGLLDALGVWNRALSLEEIEQLYNNGNGLEPEGLLFLEDSSTNNFQLSAFGNAALNTTTFKYGSGSAYFDGNGDYIQIDTSSGPVAEAFNFYNTNFTVECWIYRQTNARGIISTRNSVIYSPWVLQIWNTNVIALLIQSSSSTWYNSVHVGSVNIPQNEWVHVAWVCNNNTHTVYINGVADPNLTNLNSPILENFAQPQTVYIGNDADGIFNGYIDDLRITKGIARYTANFTPPTQQLPAPSDQYGENVSLLLHMDGTDGSTDFIDSSLNNLSLTAYGNAQIDTSIKKFGSGAAYFDGNGDYIVAPTNNNFSFTDDFTVEFWLYPLSFATDMALFDNQVLNGNGGRSNAIVLLTNTSGRYYLFTNGSIIATSSSGPTLNQWNHVALRRSGGTIRVLNNGSEVLDVNNSTQFTAGGCVIGTISDVPGNPSYGLNGYIDELRITKGVARYTANFVPQTAPFANPVAAIPTDGLLVRFNADSGISESGGTITSWTDQQNGVVAAAFNGPTLLTNEFNDRNAVSFNGSNTYFSFTFPTPISNGTPRTFVIIGRYNNPTSTGQKGYLNSSSGDLCYVFKNSNEDRSYYYTEARQLTGPSVSLANYHVQTVVHNGIPNSNFIRINGTTSTSVTYGTMDNLPQLTNMIIGGRGALSEIILGEIVEILIYNKELTPEKITQIETYANV